MAFSTGVRSPVTIDQETLDFTDQWQRSVHEIAKERGISSKEVLRCSQPASM